jgi:hypothetical protein
VEFRHYELVDGGTGAFVEHFEAHFLASHEDLGMDIVGQFTVAGRDDRFVWVRRYRDPAQRAEGLAAFYGGPVWKAFGPRANELMRDFTDVHLLVPDASGPPFAADHVAHAARPTAADGDGPEAPGTTVVAALYDRPAVTTETAAAMDAALAGAPAVRELGRLVTAGVANEFPALPVHEAPVVLWLLSADGDGSSAESAATAVAAPARLLRLRPTARSTLR